MSVDFADALEITWGLSDPFITGASPVSSVVFAQYDVAVNGVGFMIDWLDEALEGPSSLPILRAQQDTGNRPGEGSLSREDLWPRRWQSFHHGAGQRWADREASDAYRFRSSKGIDPWTQDRLTLLKGVSNPVAGTTIDEMVAFRSYNAGAVVESGVYYMDNGVAKYAQFNTDDTFDAGFSGAITGLPGNHPGTYNTLASDGTFAYIITGASDRDRVYRTTSTTAAAAWIGPITTTAWDSIGVAHGRVLAGGYLTTARLYDITTNTPAQIAQLTDPGELICAFGEGTKVIYMATTYNTSTRQNKIYSVSFAPETATLGTPVVAGVIPIGERIRTIFGYLGFLFVGTDRGFRMCRQATDGALEIGPLVTAPGDVKSFAANAQYVYFSWSNYDTASSGVGRIDISIFTTADLVPAYASDVMAPVAGTVRSVVTLDTGHVAGVRPFFTVTGGGIFNQHATDYVTSGTFDTGLVGWGISEQKDLSAIDVRTEPLAGSVTVSQSNDETSFNTIDIHDTPGSSGKFMPTNHIGGSRHEIRLTLARGAATTAPVVIELTALAWPAPQRGEAYVLPLLLEATTEDRQRYPQNVEFWEQATVIRNLTIPGTAPVTVQYGTSTFQAHIVDYQTKPSKMIEGRLQATMRVAFKNLDRTVTT